MKKINLLIKYEIINLKRGLLLWSILALYCFGWQQVFSYMISGSTQFIALYKLVSQSWLPLNLIMFPLMIVYMCVGKSENDIFKTLDIKPSQIVWYKILTSLIIGLLIIIANVIIFAVVSMITQVSIEYSLILFRGYLINSMIFIIAIISIGLFMGEITCKYIGNVLTYILLCMIFILISNFYKTSNSIFPLINLSTFPNIIEIMIYNKNFLYHNVLWLIFSLILAYCFSYKIYYSYNVKGNKIINFGLICIGLITVVCVGIKINNFQADFYKITTEKDAVFNNYADSDTTFYDDNSNINRILKYDMDIEIGNEFKNTCEIKLQISGEEVNKITLGLYKALNIEKLTVEGEEVKYTRDNNKLLIDLKNVYNHDEIINLKVIYKGIIDTKWYQGRSLFYARDSGVFLADVFEWYPKINDGLVKSYNIKVNNDSLEEIYSNLKRENIDGHFIFAGEDREVVLVSGPLMEEKLFEGYSLIGNEEVINNVDFCESAIRFMESNRNIDEQKIIFTPFIPGFTKMKDGYINAYVYPMD